MTHPHQHQRTHPHQHKRQHPHIAHQQHTQRTTHKRTTHNTEHARCHRQFCLPKFAHVGLSLATKTQVQRTICTSDTFHDVRLKKPLTFHNGFMFCYISFIYIHVIVNRQGHHNIRNGIVWVQTGDITCTCTVSLHVIELKDTPKIRIFQEIIFATTKIEFESAK